LNIANVVSAAQIARADAIHPGYGFLAENAYLAEVCEQVGITFIGPRPDSIRRFGDKVSARNLMKAAGVPVLPGTEDTLTGPDQKMIEERPSPILSSKQRAEMAREACKGIAAIGYENVGTVEFLVDDKRKFYFLEVNTRLQVEHPVTELVTSVDLVKLQIALA